MIAQTAFRIRFFSFAITVLGLAAGCGSQPQYTPSNSPRSVAVSTPKPNIASAGEKAAIVALRQVGVPYRYGGNTPQGFDCSGLVEYAYLSVGQRIARTTGQQWSTTIPVVRDDLEVGDLLFFRIDGKMSHVGLYLGGQDFVHAPASGRNVSVGNLASPFYSKAFIRAGRPR